MEVNFDEVLKGMSVIIVCKDFLKSKEIRFQFLSLSYLRVIHQLVEVNT